MTTPTPESQSSLQAQASAPAGYVLVPVEPTEEMLKAAFNAPSTNHPETSGQSYPSIYAAMLAAAPTPPAALDQQAVRDAALEKAALACESVARPYQAAGVSVALECADAIRALKSTNGGAA